MKNNTRLYRRFGAFKDNIQSITFSNRRLMTAMEGTMDTVMVARVQDALEKLLYHLNAATLYYRTDAYDSLDIPEGESDEEQR
jgi:hypothetical protein